MDVIFLKLLNKQQGSSFCLFNTFKCIYLYIYVCVCAGVSLCRLPLSLRPYIPHIGLRSSVAYLMASLALQSSATSADESRKVSADQSILSSTDNNQELSIEKNREHLIEEIQDNNMVDLENDTLNISPTIHKNIFLQQSKNYKNTNNIIDSLITNMNHKLDRKISILDPMCGSGTILAEAAYCNKVIYICISYKRLYENYYMVIDIYQILCDIIAHSNLYSSK